MTDTNDLSNQAPEEIIEQIQATRASLAEKLNSLETGVKDTVEVAKQSVQETIEEVKSTVNMREHIRNHPWEFLALSFFGGAAYGFLASPQGKKLQKRAGVFAKKEIEQRGSAIGDMAKTAVIAAGVKILQQAAMTAFRGSAAETSRENGHSNSRSSEDRKSPHSQKTFIKQGEIQ